MTAGPYKGLAPFDDSELDALLFFGRDRDRNVIVGNLMAARLTVLYGPTGVGKSSILRAGVAHGLRQETGVGVVVFDSWTGDPIAGILEAARAGRPFTEGLRGAAAAAGGDLYVVLDQFEEYFLYHEREDGPGTLAWELPELLLRRDVRVNVLLALREDAVARLDAFKGRIPNVLGNYLRLDYLDRADGHDAIVGPVDRWNDLVDPAHPVTVEPALVEAVLDETAAGKVVIGSAGRATIEEPQRAEQVEPPFLQLVMERLWDAERDAGSTTLRLATLRELGGAEAIVRDHLQRALDSLDAADKDVAVSMFDHLVTPSGMKVAHRVRDLEQYAAVGRGELEPVLSALGRERILRAVDGAGHAGARYEIFHDVLAQPVLAWKAEHEARRELGRQREESDKRHRRLLRAFALTVVAFVVMTGITIFALSQRSHARAQARIARARELAATAGSRLQVDPQQSLALGVESAGLNPTNEGEDVIRQALIAARERAILPSDGAVRTVAFRRDGRLVLTASDDGSARVWRRDGTLVRKLGHGPPLAAASFSPDGTLVLTVGADREARIWSVARGNAIAILRHGGPVTSGSFSRNGRLIVTTSEDGSARIWRVDGRAVRALQHSGPVLTASFNSDGRALVTVSSNRNGEKLRARLFDLRSGRLSRELAARGVTVAAFSPDGRLLITGGEDHTAGVWKVKTGRRLYRFADHQGGVTDALFGPGGRLVATTSSDGATRVRDVRTGVRVALMLGHVNAVNSAAFSGDGRFVVTTSTDGTARVWEAATGRLESVLRGHSDAVVAAAFSPDGRLVATASTDGTARLWDPGTAPELRLLASSRQAVRATSFSRDGRLILTASDDGTARVLTASGKLVRVLQHPDAVESAIFSRDHALVFSDDARGSMRVWRTQTGAHIRTARGVSSGPLALSPDGRLLAAPEATGAIGIRSTTTIALEKELRRERPFTVASFSPDGSSIATAGEDADARIWSAATGTLVRRLRGHTDAVTDVSFSPDGRLLVTTSRDHDGRVWDVPTGRMTALLRGHFGPVFGARFSPDSRWVVTAGPTTAGLWDVASGDLLTYLRGHTEPLTSASFSPDGGRILTSSRDGNVRTYQCQICGTIDELVVAAKKRLAALSGSLSPAERRRFLPPGAAG